MSTPINTAFASNHISPCIFLMLCPLGAWEDRASFARPKVKGERGVTYIKLGKAHTAGPMPISARRCILPTRDILPHKSLS